MGWGDSRYPSCRRWVSQSLPELVERLNPSCKATPLVGACPDETIVHFTKPASWQVAGYARDLYFRSRAGHAPTPIRLEPHELGFVVRGRRKFCRWLGRCGGYLPGN